jgi:hypothetical protein
MDNLLLEIGGKELYIDVERLSEIVRIEPDVKIEKNLELTEDEEGLEENETVDESVMQIDVTKYELYREMIGTLLSYNEEIDDRMGKVALNKTSVPFKLAYNTLLMKGIIKEL